LVVWLSARRQGFSEINPDDWKRCLSLVSRHWWLVAAANTEGIRLRSLRARAIAQGKESEPVWTARQRFLAAIWTGELKTCWKTW